MAPPLDVKKIAMIGCGSMGGGMAQLFAEHGVTVGLQDPSTQAMDNLIQTAKKAGVPNELKRFDDYDSLCAWLDKPRVFVWSLPHGFVGDKVLDGLMPYLTKGDIIIDAANEHWENTERRMGVCVTKGIRYVGMGVSGGYQAASVNLRDLATDNVLTVADDEVPRCAPLPTMRLSTWCSRSSKRWQRKAQTASLVLEGQAPVVQATTSR